MVINCQSYSNIHRCKSQKNYLCVFQPTSCVIDGSCYAAGAYNPADQCLICDPFSNQWKYKTSKYIDGFFLSTLSSEQSQEQQLGKFSGILLEPNLSLPIHYLYELYKTCKLFMSCSGLKEVKAESCVIYLEFFLKLPMMVFIFPWVCLRSAYLHLHMEFFIFKSIFVKFSRYFINNI